VTAPRLDATERNFVSAVMLKQFDDNPLDSEIDSRF
jgi:hypothetical protein